MGGKGLLLYPDLEEEMTESGYTCKGGYSHKEVEEGRRLLPFAPQSSFLAPRPTPDTGEGRPERRLRGQGGLFRWTGNIKHRDQIIEIICIDTEKESVDRGREMSWTQTQLLVRPHGTAR